MADSSGFHGTHDITLQTSGGSVVGFMLARQNGRRLWSMTEADLIQPSLPSGNLSIANIIPGTDYPLGQDDFIGGMGEFIMRSGNEYYDADGIDGSIPGYLQTAPDCTDIGYIAPSLTNGEFESVLGAEWTQASGTWAQSAAGANEGSNSVICSAAGTLAQTIAWSASYAGKTITVSAAVKATAVGGTGYIQIYDGVGTTNSSTVTGGDEWTAVSATRTLSANATELTIRLIGSPGGNTLLFDSVVVCTPTCFEPFDGGLYLAQGTVIKKLNASTGAFDVKNTFLHQISSLKAFGSSLFIALKDSVAAYTNYACWYSTDGAVYAVTAGANNTVRYLGACGTKLVGSATANTVRTNASPVSGAWSSAITVGMSSADITSILDHPDSIFIGKEDGIWYIDSASVVLMYTPEIISDTDSGTAVNMLLWKGYTYLPSGSMNFWRISQSNIIDNISPWTYQRDASTYQKRTKALAGDESFLYTILHSSTTAIILKGAETDVSGQTRWAWYPLRTVTANDIKDAVISSVYSEKRLWVAIDTGIAYLKIGVNSTAAASGTFYTPWMDGNLSAIPKAYHSLVVNSNGTFDDGGGNYNRIVISYRLAEGGSWTTWGTIGTGYGSAGSRIQRIYAPSSGISGGQIQLKFEFTQSASSANTTKLYSYACASRMRNTSYKRFNFTINLSELQVISGGQYARQDTAEALTTLLSYRNETWPLTMTDPSGTSYSIDIERIGWGWNSNEKDLDPELWVIIEATEAKLA